MTSQSRISVSFSPFSAPSFSAGFVLLTFLLLFSAQEEKLTRNFPLCSFSPKCAVCHGPHQVTSWRNWGETSIANRWEIAKKNELCYRCLRSGDRGKKCPENNRCGINDCRGTHHFHLHFERRSNRPGRVDAAVETRSAFGDSEFAGDVVWLIGSEGQKIYNQRHKSLAHTHPLSPIQCWLLRFVHNIEWVGAGERLK